MAKLIFLLVVSIFGQMTQAQSPDPDPDSDYGITTTSCKTSSKIDDSAPSCAALTASAVTVAPVIYGPPGIHYVVMASDYYMARLALALDSQGGPGPSNQLCPGDESEWNDMQTTTYWSGLDANPGQAWDLGFDTKITRRQCAFPTGTYPFLCQGLPGTPGTHGESLRWLSYIPVLTDNQFWTMFVNCWDPDRPGHNGTNYARSWIVFNKKKTLTTTERDSIIDKVVALGFSRSKVFDTAFDNPTYNPIPPYPSPPF